MRIFVSIHPGPGCAVVPALIQAMSRRGWEVSACLEAGAEKYLGAALLRHVCGSGPEGLGKSTPKPDVHLVLAAPVPSSEMRLEKGSGTDTGTYPRPPSRGFALVSGADAEKHSRDDVPIVLLRADPSATAAPSLTEAVCATVAAAASSHELAGQRVLVTAGPTVEDLDPVRFLSNRSSGRMGVALALAAWRHGAEVVLIHGPMQASVPPLALLTPLPVRSARQMRDAVVSRAAGQDVVVMCAAVADYRPVARAAAKIKKGPGELTALPLSRTPDILAELGAMPPPTRPLLVGFAAETENHAVNAVGKLRAKNCDLICANDVGGGDSGFGVSTNQITLYGRDGNVTALPLLPKDEAAERIIERVAALLAE